MIQKSKHRFKQLVNYITSVDRVWLYTWGVIFVGFIVLDSYFQARFHGHNVIWDVNAFGHMLHIRVISNGTFIGVTALKYLGIILNVIYAHKKFPSDHLLQIALFLTLLADTILVINSTSELGVLAFCFAQYFHLSRFAGTSPNFFFGWTLFMTLLLLFGQINGIQDIYVLACIYGVTLLCNIALTARWWLRTRQGIVSVPINKKAQVSTSKASTKKESEFITKFKQRYINLPPESRRLETVASSSAVLGFILFFCCDFNVALSYLAVTGVLPIKVAVFANFFAWFFYYPSQVLISNSSVLIERTLKKP